MAVTICSSSPNHSPTLPSTVSLSSSSSLPTVSSSLKTLHHNSLQLPTLLLSNISSSSSSSKFGCDDALVIASAAAEAVALASEAMEAARDAVSAGDVLYYNKDGQRQSETYELGMSDINMNNVVGVRRRKRRKRIDRNGNGDDDDQLQVLFNSAKSARCLTRKEEAEFCRCLKEGARLEAVRRGTKEPREHDLTSDQWAKAVGLKRRSLDRKLCNERESRERITSSYRKLVVSIATAYQGKGLSLQDLIQEGSIGLLRGAERFDPERGYKLSTYVYWWIKQAIIRAIANKSRVVRLPLVMCRETCVRCWPKLQKLTICWAKDYGDCPPMMKLQKCSIRMFRL